jgi:hypothetical protein
VITWVDDQCRDWGAHKRYLACGVNGYPAINTIGRLITEGFGAGQMGLGSFTARIPIRDDPANYAIVSVALQRMAATHEMEWPHRIVYAHYFYLGKAKQKAPDLGLKLRQYWQHLHAAHAFIAACEVNVPRGEDSCAQEFACA